MASYSQFLGLKVTVQYRAGDNLLGATATFVGDSGRSIFLEQHLEQRGRMTYFRWEIPYQCIHRVEEARELEKEAATECKSEKTVAPPRASAAAASQSGSSLSPIVPLTESP